MTAKKKIELVAAQYAQLAREMTKQGDLLSSMAKMLDEDGAQAVLDELVALALIDADGMLTVHATDYGAGDGESN